MRRVACFAPLLLLLMGACSPTALLNAVAPRDGVTVQQDVRYAPGARGMLDVYTPQPPRANAPVVVFFYGGNWESGDRGMYRFVGAALAARGVVVVIPDYRLYPEVRFPAFMHDAAAAVAWTHANAAHFGGDPSRLFFMGHSAGAQIATLLALDPTYLSEVGVRRNEIAAVIGLAGPYDFLPVHTDTLKAIFGPEPERPRSQPINYVTADAPPMFLAAGDDDTTVEPSNTLRLAARLRADGVVVTEKIYPGIGHKALIGAFSSPLTFLAPVQNDVLRFVFDHHAPHGHG